MNNSASIFVVFIVVVLSFACRKEILNTDPDFRLKFSRDVVLFDTVFAKIGSKTEVFKAINTSNKTVRIDEIRFGTGQNSNFRMNVNGFSGNIIYEVDILPRDSIYIFVEVTVDPQNSNTPFVVRDSIIFSFNGVQQDVKLMAWGKDAIYFYPDNFVPGLPAFSIIPCNATFTKEKPYVIVGYAVVDSDCNLTIEAGAQINFFTNAGLWVFTDGSIQAEGTVEEPIIFQGARPSFQYSDIPGQWDRIWINQGKTNNVFRNCIIKNGIIGIQAEPIPLSDLTSPRNLELHNVQIYNMLAFGLFTRAFNIQSYNLIVGNCGNASVLLTYGGAYLFEHTTIANYWTRSNRQNASLIMSDREVFGASDLSVNFNAEFRNAIVYGSAEHEVITDVAIENNFNVKFDHALLRLSPQAKEPKAQQVNTLINENPLFEDVRIYDYRLKQTSPARGKGNVNFVLQNLEKLNKDISGNIRPTGISPDLGAHQSQQ